MASAAAALAAGCATGIGGADCRKPPTVACTTFKQPTAQFWRTNKDEDAAARAVVGVRSCTDLIGQPLRRAIELYGEPFPQDGTSLSPTARIRVWGWQAKTGMYIAYDRSPQRRIKAIVLMADTGSSADAGWSYCGAEWRRLGPYEKP